MSPIDTNAQPDQGNENREQMANISEQVRSFVTGKFPEAFIAEDGFRDQQSFYIKPDPIVDICRALMEDSELAVQLLADITSLDWLGHKEEEKGRFEVVYNLYSLKHSYRFFLKVRLPADNPRIDTLTNLWNGANWMEREVWDMMGIEFVGHPNLERILTPDDMEGHPLRKDFPLTYEVPVFTWNKDDPPEVIK